MRVSTLIVVPALFLAAACAQSAARPAPAQPKPMTLYEALGMKEPGLRGAELEAAIRKASVHPLGSEANPVRATGVTGQRAYLARLRCSDGRPPRILGRGTGMPSPFGGITDIYGVRCEGTSVTVPIAMDMYHEHVELRPVPGFTIAMR